MKYVWGLTKEDILETAKEMGVKLSKEELETIIHKLDWAIEWEEGVKALIEGVKE